MPKYRILIENLEDNEVLVDSKTDLIMGAYISRENENESAYAHGIRFVSDSNEHIMHALMTLERVYKKTLDDDEKLAMVYPLYKAMSAMDEEDE